MVLSSDLKHQFEYGGDIYSNHINFLLVSNFLQLISRYIISYKLGKRYPRSLGTEIIEEKRSSELSQLLSLLIHSTLQKPKWVLLVLKKMQDGKELDIKMCHLFNRRLELLSFKDNTMCERHKSTKRFSWTRKRQSMNTTSNASTKRNKYMKTFWHFKWILHYSKSFDK